MTEETKTPTIAPKHLQFLEVVFLKPTSKNPESRDKIQEPEFSTTDNRKS